MWKIELGNLWPLSAEARQKTWSLQCVWHGGVLWVRKPFLSSLLWESWVQSRGRVNTIHFGEQEALFLSGSCRSNPVVGFSLTAKAGIEILLFQSSFDLEFKHRCCDRKAHLRAGSGDADQFTPKLSCDYGFLQKIVLWRKSIEALLLWHAQVLLESLNSRVTGLKDVRFIGIFFQEQEEGG